MSIFYDPLKKKPRKWVFMTLVSIPIILMIATWLIGKYKIKNNSNKPEEPVEDILEKF
ncbi:MAG: hypothetical protein KKF78_06915 [Candidatus Omnitrophica bacterium]|nr:hypothetical protein [Candidatus Omnitrophota bacterium]MBU1996869.1 hypothetical protein [Candidatus Omnitrophota bacterium]